MKTVMKNLGPMMRLGVTAIVLLMTQQAMALGTDPGVTISNTASVDYEVNGTGQPTETSNAASFLVDRRVAFDVARMGGALTPTDAGDLATDVPAASNYLDFYVTNLSNGALDFNLAFEQLLASDGDIYGGGTADTGVAPAGGGDDVDMGNVRIRVASGLDPAGAPGTGPEPTLADNITAIDDLPEDRSIRVRIYADTPGTLTNLDISGLRLLATAAAPNAVPLPGDPAEGTNLLEDTGADVPGEVDNVFVNAADGNGNATESDVDGFLVSSADLTVAKTAIVSDDPFGGVAPNAKAVPGATITYTITIDNTAGGVDATNVAISDLIQVLEVVLVESAPGSGVSTITLTPSVGAPSTCNADLDGTDDTPAPDGCVFDPATNPDTLEVTGLTVPAGQSLDVSFDVTIL